VERVALNPFTRLVFSVVFLALLVFTPAAGAEQDPLFGDLPSLLVNVDRVTEQDFSNLIRAIQNRISSEASISGLSPGGFSYEIGPLGLPAKTSSSLGTIWTAGAEPIGKGRLSLGISYTYLDFDSFGCRNNCPSG
jgi:hypothetical protein